VPMVRRDSRRGRAMEEFVCIIAGLAVGLNVVGLLRIRDTKRRQLRFEANRLVDDIYREIKRPGQRRAATAGGVIGLTAAEARPVEIENEFARLATNIELQRTSELERRIGALHSLRHRVRNDREGEGPEQEPEAPGLASHRPAMQTLH
jgi:hypothetical protein